jgi:hypothetical protein
MSHRQEDMATAAKHVCKNFSEYIFIHQIKDLSACSANFSLVCKITDCGLTQHSCIAQFFGIPALEEEGENVYHNISGTSVIVQLVSDISWT